MRLPPNMLASEARYRDQSVKTVRKAAAQNNAREHAIRRVIDRAINRAKKIAGIPRGEPLPRLLQDAVYEVINRELTALVEAQNLD